MSLADVSLACARALVDELMGGGVRHACVSPGSRSTPLALALDRHPRLTVHVHLDERSSGFFALGLAKALREPVAIACTSGTAAAELFPAVVEASQSRVPLILLTADRPPRLRGSGANQTIDQVELYGRYVRAYLEVPVPATDDDRQPWAFAGRRAIDASRGTTSPDGETARPGGPVHVNCPVDEPLTPTVVERPAPATASAGPAPRGGDPDPFDRLLRSIDIGDRPMLVAGPMSESAGDIAMLAATLRVPLIADALSGWRRPATPAPGTASAGMTAGTALLESDRWLRAHMPGSVVLFGDRPTSRAVQRLVDEVDRIVVVHDGQLDPSPDRPDAIRIRRPPSLATGIGAGGEPGEHASIGPDTSWLAAWREADAAARTAIDTLLDSWDETSEMRVARDVAAALPGGGTLFVGNSMPVRDLDAYMSPRLGLRVLANRGASGIDGLLSTALGAAASGTGPVLALLGDLSFLYDAGALLWNARRGIDLVVVVNDNAGGQIFAGLGQRDLPADELERLFVTPCAADDALLCRAAGAGHTVVERASDLVPVIAAAAAGGGLQVVQVAIDPERDRARRAEIRASVSVALEGVAPG